MSHKWAANAYAILSERAMQEVRKVIQGSPFLISHDNVNMPLRVFSQRLHNQSHFISATAATVWILPIDAALPVETNRNFNTFHALHSDKVFNFKHVLYGSEDADDRIEAQHEYRLLRIVLDCPDFSDYDHHDHPIFSPPPPVEQLPSGPENATRQYILRTCEIEEASYDGTLKVMAEFFKQLNLNTEIRLAALHLSHKPCNVWPVGSQIEVVCGCLRHVHDLVDMRKDVGRKGSGCDKERYISSNKCAKGTQIPINRSELVTPL